MKNNLVFGVIVGVILSFGLDILAETVITSNAVSYSNNKTEETTVSGALDELFSAVDINEKIDEIEEKIDNNLSHIGMIVQSSTLDTMEKVIERYGGTTWTKIEGKFLLGASSTYAVNSTGGSETNTLTIANLPSHTHTVGAHSHGLNNHTHSIPALSGSTNNTGAHTHNVTFNGGPVIGMGGDGVPNVTTGGGGFTYVRSSTANSAGNHTHTVTTTASTTGAATGSTANSTEFNSGTTGSGTAVNNMPPYKTVYIWERTA